MQQRLHRPRRGTGQLSPSARFLDEMTFVFNLQEFPEGDVEEDIDALMSAHRKTVERRLSNAVSTVTSEHIKFDVLTFLSYLFQ